jgi:hypothetical protein
MKNLSSALQKIAVCLALSCIFLTPSSLIASDAASQNSSSVLRSIASAATNAKNSVVSTLKTIGIHIALPITYPCNKIKNTSFGKKIHRVCQENTCYLQAAAALVGTTLAYVAHNYITECEVNKVIEELREGALNEDLRDAALDTLNRELDTINDNLKVNITRSGLTLKEAEDLKALQARKDAIERTIATLILNEKDIATRLLNKIQTLLPTSILS